MVCEFAKVAVLNILLTKLDFPKHKGEKSNEYKAKVLKVKYRQYITKFNEKHIFNLEYRRSLQSFKRNISNTKSLEKTP